MLHDRTEVDIVRAHVEKMEAKVTDLERSVGRLTDLLTDRLPPPLPTSYGGHRAIDSVILHRSPSDLGSIVGDS